MSVVGDFTVPAAAFSLDHGLSTVPEMTVEADRLASHSTTEVLPFLWATGGDFERFEAALGDDSTVDTVSVADRTDEDVLYRLRWAQEFRDLVDDMVDHHAAISEASAGDGQWRLKLRFAEEDMISDFQEHFRDTGHDFEVHHLSRPREPRQRAYGLTQAQYETLVAAVRDGYFGVPRDASVAELGDSLGVSANAASQRLRRGCRTLVENALTIDDEET